MNDLPVVRSPWRILILVLGFTFLYAPMLMLVIYSFNSSKLVTVWAGWSTRWYSELFHDDAMMSAVGLSLTIAACAATAAAILGTIAAVVMVRFGRFRGSNGFAFMITAPLVMPDVITGLSLLLLFVALGHAIGWPSDRGMLTIWLAHVTFCTAYVAVVISSRLRELDHSIEEAAMDLGAAPLKVFFVITLPMIMPAVISGWLLAFTLSLDDLVIASFVSRSRGHDLADAGLLQRAHGGKPGDQRPGDAHPRRGRYCWFYRLVFDGPRRKAASARYPACKTRLNHLKSVQQPSGSAPPLWRRFHGRHYVGIVYENSLIACPP
ncbi:putrescine transporter subunit: membrane component of ABC superfamily [Klebsiella pneumoniae subsp. ozaenae]|uniref:Putrescine transporter subunit: membrane component of ABC superfamily n=9 Tax=Klebsiella pneumoniae complex TaxID=3390273 RepID=A0A377ZZH2_KLEPO|nr:putrescine transporter subunit: membrane component of ABC superfamily [Klebsiella pneumoniae subsp. ozaenae]